jgi:hypothetical protein
MAAREAAVMAIMSRHLHPTGWGPGGPGSHVGPTRGAASLTVAHSRTPLPSGAASLERPGGGPLRGRGLFRSPGPVTHCYLFV